MNLFEFNLALPITDPTWVFFLVLIIILFAPMILGLPSYTSYYRYDSGRCADRRTRIPCARP